MGKPAQCVLFLFPGYNAPTMIMLEDGGRKSNKKRKEEKRTD
jgi:hypothetical protein